MNFQEYKEIYHQMPEKYRKHGDMPTQYEMYDDVDNYRNVCCEECEELVKEIAA